MNRGKLPNGVLTKLVELDEQAEFFNRKVDDIERGIAAARTRLTGGFQKDHEYHSLRASLEQLIADKPVLEMKLHRTQHMLSACRAWLDELPEGTQLKIVNVKPDGYDLGDVRERIKEAENELALLRAVPTPAPDIRDRVEAYVQSLAQPEVRGISAGQKFEVKWPNSVIAAFALLFPKKVQEVVLAEVERMANDPLPQAERKKRIAELKREIDELAYLEEALVVASGAERSPSAPVRAVLGVQVAETKRVTRAAHGKAGQHADEPSAVQHRAGRGAPSSAQVLGSP
jgi:hypothetical protein